MESSDRNRFARCLRLAMEKKGLTNKALHLATGFSISSISTWRNQNVTPEIKKMRPLLKALGYSNSDFWGMSSPTTEEKENGFFFED